MDCEWVIASTDKSSDDESDLIEGSIEEAYTETALELPVSTGIGNCNYNITNRVIFKDRSLDMFIKIQKYLLSKRTVAESTIISDEEYDEPLSGWVESVSPSDELAYQQMFGLLSDSSENSSTSGRSMLQAKVDFSEPMEEELTIIASNRKKNETTNTATCKGPHHLPTPQTGVELLGNTIPAPKPTWCEIPQSQELVGLIEQQKDKSRKGFLDWKAQLPKFFGNRLDLLSEVFRVDLNTLKEGKYLFGSDFFINSTQAAKGVAYVGLIRSEGRSGKKFLTVSGRKSVELNIGYTQAVTELLTVKVHANRVLSLYNKSNPSFQKVCAGPSNLAFDYHPQMIFVGIITANHRFMVNILGQDVEFNIDYFSNGCQVIYSDHLAKKQKIFSSRVVKLNVLTRKFAVMDFNYSYASNTSGKYQPKFIDHLILAGANPCYF